MPVHLRPIQALLLLPQPAAAPPCQSKASLFRLGYPFITAFSLVGVTMAPAQRAARGHVLNGLCSDTLQRRFSACSAAINVLMSVLKF
jgi:hypothetical protein